MVSSLRRSVLQIPVSEEAPMPSPIGQPMARIEAFIPSGYDPGLFSEVGPDGELARVRQTVILEAAEAVRCVLDVFDAHDNKSADQATLTTVRSIALTALNQYADLWGVDDEDLATRTQFALVVSRCLETGVNLFGRIAMPKPQDVVVGGQHYFRDMFVPPPEHIDQMYTNHFAHRYAAIHRRSAAPLAIALLRAEDGHGNG